VSGLLGDRGGALGASLLAGASIRPDAALAPVPGG
jgi:hypothetical protein